MKRKTIANLIMIAAILVIAAAGVLTVGFIQGWFDDPDMGCMMTDIRGIVTLQRDGIAFPVSGKTVLRSGDKVITEPGAGASILSGSSSLFLNGNTELEILEIEDIFSVSVLSGEAFCLVQEDALTLSCGTQTISLSNTASAVSVRTGSQDISVFYGSVTCGSQTAAAGQALRWAADTLSVSEIAIQSLNDFTIRRIRSANAVLSLCFTNAELEQLEADRLQQIKDQIQDQLKPSQPTDPDLPPITGTSCTIAIRCDTILDHMDDLNPNKAGYVPENGVILAPITVAVYDGETVFDVLKRVCDAAKIPLEYSWTPLYGSSYVEGIHHLYEFDCGEQSGWMYQVNGWFPNYGCSEYVVEDGDYIDWCFTCEGLGTDVGAPEW